MHLSRLKKKHTVASRIAVKTAAVPRTQPTATPAKVPAGQLCLATVSSVKIEVFVPICVNTTKVMPNSTWPTTLVGVYLSLVPRPGNQASVQL